MVFDLGISVYALDRKALYGRDKAASIKVLDVRIPRRRAGYETPFSMTAASFRSFNFDKSGLTFKVGEGTCWRGACGRFLTV